MRGGRIQKNACEEGANFETGVCSARVCAFYMQACMTASSCKQARVCARCAQVQRHSHGSNEISCPRECTNRASIAPGDVYQPAAPQTATACQLCRSVSQTHRLLLKRAPVLHTILSLSQKHTQLLPVGRVPLARPSPLAHPDTQTQTGRILWPNLSAARVNQTLSAAP